MKLNTAQQQRVEAQLGIEAVPEDHPANAELEKAFGSHTFFLVSDGLHVVEEDLAPGVAGGNVVRIASWANNERTELLGHAPEVLEVTVALEDGKPDTPG